MENFSMNWLAILVSALIPLIIGAIWYHPKVFGTAWMNATGITEAKIKTMSPTKAYIAAVLLSVILSFYLYVNVMTGGPDDMRHGQELFMTFKHGAFLGILVVFPVLATNGVFEMKSAKYIFINLLDCVLGTNGGCAQWLASISL